jgi:4-hydroxybenzoate polyprenyltransferase
LWMGVYSAPPFRLKGRAGWDILWHFIAFFALVLWGSFLAGSVSMIHFLVAVSFGLFGCFAQIDNHIQDYPFDKASGSKTFAVWIGREKAQTALKMIFIVYLLSLVPLMVLYSFQSILSGLILCGGIFMSLLLIQKHKILDVSSFYRVIYFFGGSVYMTCLLFHLGSIL